MTTNPDFELDVHRRTAERVISGRATAAEVEASQEALLDEVARLTALLHPPVSILIPATGIDDLITALAASPKAAALYTESGGVRSMAGSVGSYRGYYDHLRISTGSRKLRTVADMLKWLQSLKREGFGSDGVPYNPSSANRIRMAEIDNTSDGVLAGIRIEDDKVILVGHINHDW